MQYESFLPIEYATDPEKRQAVLEIVSELPLNQRLALLAHFYGGLSVIEIATAMKAPVWAADKYLVNACERVVKKLGIADMIMNAPNEHVNAPVLKKIFDQYEAEMITDEQKQRVLAPVLKMIREDKFERSRWQRYSWFIIPLIAIATVVALIITVAVTQTG